MSKQIARRTFLRGVGTAMSLPLLDGMLPLRALAQSEKSAAAQKIIRPNRMLFCFVPNGMHMPDWTPTSEGAFELPWILEPLQNVKDNLTVLSGLAQHNASALGDGGGDHARSTATFLTGVHVKKTDGADIKGGISVDQLAAQHIGNLTKFPSLEVGIERGRQAGSCDTGYSCAYSSSISWRSESTPVAKETNPRLVFERLFGNGEAQEEAASRERRELYKKSILDFVLEDASSLKAQLNTRDQQKLDEYFTGVREIEQRLNRVEKESETSVPLAAKPSGIPQDPGEHIRLMSDMVVLAMQSDLTRISTFMFANDGSNRSYRNIGISEGHHELSHHGNDAAKQDKIRQINRFHITQLAYMLEKMKSINEGEGTMLDNSMVVFGAGISDGNRHNHNDLPILLAGGGAGTLKTGRHIRYEKDTPLNNLFLAMLDRVGVPADTLGDSTGRLEQLF